MSQEKVLNLAFLGCGFATHLHSKTLSGFGGRVHCHYASRDIAKAESYNIKYKGDGAFASYEAAIQSDRIDAVLVATPPVQHLGLTLSALRAGKHVIVEKPPFLTTRDFDRVINEQKKSGKQVFVAENYFYKPLLRQLRQLIQSGIIGDILFVNANALKEQKITDWRDNAELSGGGALFEGGIHWVNFVANLGLTLDSVHGFRPGSHAGMDRSMLVGLRYAEGAVGTLFYSWETPSLFKGLRMSKIYGRKGSITFESNGIFMIVRGTKKRFILPGFKDIAGYKGMFSDFITAMQEGRPAVFTLEMARNDLQTIEQVYASVKSATKEKKTSN